MMRSRLVLASVLALWTLPVDAADSPPAPSPVNLPGRDLVLHVRHEHMVPECRPETGELVQSVLQELLIKGFVVHLSREYVEAEISYYREHATNEAPAATAQAVLACLDGSLKRGVLDWSCLRAAHTAAPDSAAVMRNFPWLHPRLDGSTVRLAAATHNLPVLELTLTWEGLPVRSIVAFGTPKLRDVTLGDHAPVYFGTTHVWNIPATLRLRQGGTVVFERTYPAEAWKKQYINSSDMPHYRMTQKILEDLHANLMPPQPRPPGGKSRKTKTS